MCLTYKCSMASLPAILTLQNTRIYTYISNDDNESSQVKALIDKLFGFHDIL